MGCNVALSFVFVNGIEDKMINKILSTNILKEMSLEVRISRAMKYLKYINL